MNEGTYAAHVRKLLRDALQNLVDLKAYKKRYGKDAYYQKTMPVAWQNAQDLLDKVPPEAGGDKLDLGAPLLGGIPW